MSIFAYGHTSISAYEHMSMSIEHAPLQPTAHMGIANPVSQRTSSGTSLSHSGARRCRLDDDWAAAHRLCASARRPARRPSPRGACPAAGAGPGRAWCPTTPRFRLRGARPWPLSRLWSGHKKRMNIEQFIGFSGSRKSDFASALLSPQPQPLLPLLTRPPLLPRPPPPPPFLQPIMPLLMRLCTPAP